MITRIMSGIVVVVALIFILVFMPPVATAIAVGIVSAYAYVEFCRANIEKNFLEYLPFVLAGLIMGIFIMYFDYTLPCMIFGLMLMLVLMVVLHKKVSFSVVSKIYLGTVYIFAMLKYVFETRMQEEGLFLVFAIFIGAFVTDTGAYFVGYFLGKHKLIPLVSPKKTIEGAVGGVVITVLAFLIYAFIGEKAVGVNINFSNLIIIAFVLPVVSQFGDLAASFIKREINIKDYGNILPGHGGMLDRFDSVLFVAPMFYYLNVVLPILK